VSAGSRRDQQQAFFIGGSEELQDMSYVAVPRGHKGPVLNKYGYKTQVSGNVKVRAAAPSACFVCLFASNGRPTAAAPLRALQCGQAVPACCPGMMMRAGTGTHGAAGGRGGRRLTEQSSSQAGDVSGCRGASAALPQPGSGAGARTLAPRGKQGGSRGVCSPLLSTLQALCLIHCSQRLFLP
jgi:hypothetical protein